MKHLLALLALALLTACGGGGDSGIEEDARQQIPVSVCTETPRPASCT